MAKKFRVCVVGGGPQGLAALKNLLELNDENNDLFDAEILESRDCIGGIWKFSADPSTVTALPSTVGNVSKWRNCYSDFPVSEAWREAGRGVAAPAHLNQEEMAFYLEQYANKFGLLEHVRFGCRVIGFQRSSDGKLWHVNIKDAKTGTEKVELYDKVVVASGQYSTPNIPKIEGIERFQGDIIHSIQFKSTKPFKDRKVLIVGSGNTAADVSTELVGTASSIYLSHRRGVLIFPRIFKNKPLEQVTYRRLNAVKFGLTSLAPVFFNSTFSDNIFVKVCDSAWGERLNPEWNLRPAPSVSFTIPIISDAIIPALEIGSVQLVRGIRQVLDDRRVELDNGEIIDFDSIIFCTSYVHNSDVTQVVDFEGELSLPRLYQNIYHPCYSDSLAYMTFWQLPTGICEIGELMAMGIAQVFSGRYQLPSSAIMNREIDHAHAFVRGLANRSTGNIKASAAGTLLDEGPWRTFLNDVAGAEVNEKLGYGLQGWKFWWQDRELCNMLMTGTDSLHVYRLFDGRPGSRRKWDGARAAIEEANRDLEALEKRLTEDEKVSIKKTV